jgi:flagellar hook protein FlgE
MMRSLWSGVSGLQAHQIAMDVEGNNIANVNTTGFKYSRVNFSEMLAQTSQIATAPQGDLGGRNPLQIGLGTKINSTTRIFAQGSVQATDKNTDVAIQGDGFFILSKDGGKNYTYTRAGDFKFDADGNFVDNNGYVVQGWPRDEDTGRIDSSSTPIRNINIPPGLTTPAYPSTNLALKANLNSGDTVYTYSPTFGLDSFNKRGDLNRNGTLDGSEGATLVNENSLDLSDYNTDENNKIIEHAEDVSVLFTNQGKALQLTDDQGVWVGFTAATYTSGGAAAINTVGTLAAGEFTFTLSDGATVDITGTIAGTGAVQQAESLASLINAKSVQTGVIATVNQSTGEMTLTNDNTRDSKNIQLAVNAGAGGGTAVTNFSTGFHTPMKRFQYTSITSSVGWDQVAPTANQRMTYSFKTTEDLREGMQQLARDVLQNGFTAVDEATIGYDINQDGDTTDTGLTMSADNIKVEVNSEGKFEVFNNGTFTEGGTAGPSGLHVKDYDVTLSVYGYSDPNTTENTLFTKVMRAMSGALPHEGGGTASRLTQDLNAATHSSSIDIYDSLGSKHTVKVDFRKVEVDPTTGTTWDLQISVPEPGELAGAVSSDKKNIQIGKITFNNDGSLSTFSPPSIDFTGNNGSAPKQNVRFEFGTSNAFDGITSFESRSATSGISQDGYPGGDLVGIVIDQSGTLMGSFSNGRSFGLAQIGMAKFTNNEGLQNDGGNLFIQSANSGDPIIGSASTGGRGLIQSSSLEMSNVDLSRSLTQLIVVQRGFQANSKTITTSDQFLETLIGLKR